MLLRILKGSLRHRAGRVLVAALSVVMGASLVATLASLSLDVGAKAGRELRAYGANVVIGPRTASAQAGVGGMEFGTVREERYLEQSSLAALRKWGEGEILGYSPYLVGVAEANGHRVPVVGVTFERIRALRPWWAVEGEWASDSGLSEGATPVDGMLGTALAERMGVRAGELLRVRSSAVETDLLVRGTVETGGDEDGQLFLPLPAAQLLLARPGLVGAVEVSASAERRPLAEIAAELERKVPGSRARVVGQIADAEASVLGKVRMLVGLVAVLVLLASGLAVGSTMAASVMERTREIGLMKALGAGRPAIALIFLVEAAAIALLGAVPGFVLGLGLAQAVGQAVFGAGIAPSLLAAPATLAAVSVVCLVASILPIRRALAVDPAQTLRGE